MVITNITEAFNPQDTIMKLSFFFQETTLSQESQQVIENYKQFKGNNQI